ncbi:MAG: sugar phosphate isomerase/epimerase [Cytophagia bacterium]|nr:sugar phosphate isomerase/epimerase [Cytophagia bacterium]
MLDLGFVSAILPNKNLDEVLAFAQKEHFTCVEVMCWPSENADTRRYAGVSHISVDALSHDELLSLKDKLANQPVKISALGYYPNPMDPDEKQASFYRNHIKKIIKAASVLGIGNVNTFVGRDFTKNIDYNISKFKEVWPEIIDLADSLNIKIGIENCPMFFSDDEWPGGKNLATTPKIWDQLFSIIPSNNFGLNYDPSHMVWQMMDYLYPIYAYKDKLHHIHLKDVKVYHDKLNQVGILANPLEYHSPKIPGLGDIHWGSFISALNDVRYRGPIVIEVEDKAYEGSDDDIVKAIRSARNHLNQFLP